MRNAINAGNAEAANTATHCDRRNVPYFEATAGKRIAPRLALVVPGFVSSSATADNGTSATHGNPRSNLMGIGPAGRYIIRGRKNPVALVA